MSKSSSKVKDEYLKKLEPVCEAIAQALTTVVEVDKQNEKEIDDVLIDAVKEIQECENAVASMTEMSGKNLIYYKLFKTTNYYNK